MYFWRHVFPSLEMRRTIKASRITRTGQKSPEPSGTTHNTRRQPRATYTPEDGFISGCHLSCGPLRQAGGGLDKYNMLLERRQETKKRCLRRAAADEETSTRAASVSLQTDFCPDWTRNFVATLHKLNMIFGSQTVGVLRWGILV